MRFFLLLLFFFSSLRMAANASFPLISFSLFINLFHLHDSVFIFSEPKVSITIDAYFFLTLFQNYCYLIQFFFDKHNPLISDKTSEMTLGKVFEFNKANTEKNAAFIYQIAQNKISLKAKHFLLDLNIKKPDPFDLSVFKQANSL